MEEFKWPAITKDTPLPEFKRIHQMIWNYVVEYGKKPETPYRGNCVLCMYDSMHRGPHHDCYKCPVVWPKNDMGASFCTFGNGLYSRWGNAKGEEKTALAEQIRDLPWKYELEEKTLL